MREGRGGSEGGCGKEVRGEKREGGVGEGGEGVGKRGRWGLGDGEGEEGCMWWERGGGVEREGERKNRNV